MDEFGADVVGGSFLKRKKLFLYMLQKLKSAETKSLETSTRISRHQSCESTPTYVGLSKTLWETGT